MTISHVLTATLVTLTFGAMATAQEQVHRGRYAGWVQNADDKRVANASVVLLSRPLPSRPDLGIADERQVVTGKDGMFRTTLLHGRAYSAWATWQGKRGVAHRSRIVEGVFPGPPRAIEEAAKQTVRTIRVTGTEHWPDHAPLQLNVLTSSDNVAAMPIALDAHGVGNLPTLPGNSCEFELRGKNGMILGMLVGAKLAAAGPTQFDIKMSEPKQVRVVVTDDAGAPVVNALVRHAFGYHRRDLMAIIGNTDEQGVLDVIVPTTNPMYVGDSGMLCLFQITAPGRQRLLSWVQLDKIKGSLELTMPDGIDLQGKVLARDGSPARGITLLPDCYAMGSSNASTGVGVPPRPAPLGADGAFHFSSLHPKYDFRLLALLDPDMARAQGMNLHKDIAVAPVVWLATGAPAYAKPHRLPDIHMDEIPIAQIRVTTDDGVPVPGARLTATTKDLYNSPMNYVCDRVGRLQFPLPKEAIRIGAWVPGGGVATQLIQPPRDADDATIDPLIIKLSPTYTVQGVVVDGAGKPIPNATVYQWDRAKTDDRNLAEMTFLGRARSASGGNGQFSLTLPLAEVAFAIRAFARIDGKMHNSQEVMIVPGDPNNEQLRIEVVPHKK
jgi:hypothetical protein